MPLNHFLPAVGNDSVGQRTAFGTWVPPGARVAAYVGPQSESTDAYSSSSLLVSTLAAGLARCRAGKGDVVFVLPGHTETVSTTTMLDALVSGTQIIGCAPFGSGLMPTFTFAGTTNTSTWTVDDANVTIANIKFNCDGADSIDTPLVVTAAGFRLEGCLVNLGSSTTLDCDTFLTLGAGSTNAYIVNNKMQSTSTAVNTNVISITAAVDGITIAGNFIRTTLSSATGGVIQIGAAATNLDIHHNVIRNFVEDGVGIRVADTFAATGMIYCNFFGGTDAGGTVANTIKAVSFEGTTEALLRCFENYATDEDTGSGVISPAAATT